MTVVVERSIDSGAAASTGWAVRPERCRALMEWTASLASLASMPGSVRHAADRSVDTGWEALEWSTRATPSAAAADGSAPSASGGDP